MKTDWREWWEVLVGGFIFGYGFWVAQQVVMLVGSAVSAMVGI